MPDFTSIDVYKTRKTLIERCKEDDPEAWYAFYAPYRNFARYIIKDRYFDLSNTEVEELSQAVMVRVAESIAKFDPSRPSRRHPGENVKFHSWFWNQVRAELRTYFAAKKKRRAIFEYDPELEADLARFDEQFYAQCEEAIKAKAMELLTRSRTKPCTIEAYQMQLNGCAVPAIAGELGMTENQVHQAVCRCRRFLEEHRRELEELL